MSKKFNKTKSINFEFDSGAPVFRKSRGARVRKIIADVLLGLFVMAVGVGYLGNYIDFLPWSGFTVFFPGWGALFLIVPAVYWLIRRPLSWFWPICLLIGILILLSKQESYTFGKAAAIVLAVEVVLMGLRIILAPIFKRMRRKKWHKAVSHNATLSSVQSGSDPSRDYAVHLGDRTVNIVGEEFTSATLSCHLGNLIFNINSAIITDCAVIDATCRLGNLQIHTPAGARVEVSNTFASGNFENHHISPTAPDAPVIYINVDGSLGNVEIF